MTEFVGRTGAQRVYSYPETPRASAIAASIFARNFARGPGADAPVPIATTAGTQVPWGTIDVPGTSPEVHSVPITPKSTGVVRVSAMVTVQNLDTIPQTLHAVVQLDSSTQEPTAMQATVPTNVAQESGGFTMIPLLVELSGLAIGVTVNVQILLTALTGSVLVLPLDASTIDVSEVPVSTG